MRLFVWFSEIPSSHFCRTRLMQLPLGIILFPFRYFSASCGRTVGCCSVTPKASPCLSYPCQHGAPLLGLLQCASGFLCWVPQNCRQHLKYSFTSAKQRDHFSGVTSCCRHVGPFLKVPLTVFSVP